MYPWGLPRRGSAPEEAPVGCMAVEYACHEANTPIANNLSGARVTEKAAAEAKTESK
jgi:hypothetical protein